MEKKTHYALAEGDINGRYRKAGESVGELTEREAKYLVMHGVISATNPEGKGDKEDKAKDRTEPEPAIRSEPDPVTLDRKTR